MNVRRFQNATVIALSIVFAWCLIPKADAQPSSLDVSQYLATHWRAQDGYFQGNIQALAQTTDGYIWLGTGFGLLRFDGMRFTEWKTPADNALPVRPIQSLLASKGGSLWIGGMGLSELREGVMHRYHEFDHLSIGALAEDIDGSIWVGILAKLGQPALCRIQSREAKCFSGSNYPQSWVRSLFVDSSGRSWAGSDNALWQIGPGKPKSIGNTGGEISSITEDAQGALLLANDSMLSTLSSLGVIKEYLLPKQTKQTKAWRLLRTRDGEVWIGTFAEGIVHYHHGLVDKYATQDGLPANSLNAMIQDHEGNIWVASGNGLSRFTRSPVATITSKQGLTSDQVFSVLATRDNSVWVGSMSGLDRLVGSTIEKPVVKLPGETTKTLFETEDGRLLIFQSMPAGTFWLDHGHTIRLKNADSDNVFAVSSGSHDDLWLAVRETGLRHVSLTGELLGSWPWKSVGIGGDSLAFDPARDGVWIGSSRGDLGLFKDGKLIQHYGGSDGLGQLPVRDIRVAEDGSVTAATGSGLVRLFHDKLAFLNHNNGMPCDNLHWMRRGGNGYIWLYAECGLVQISATDLEKWMSDSSHQITVMKWITNLEGVPNLVFGGSWYTPQATETRDGRILFATTSGLGVIDERSGLKNALPPPVTIETVTADGKDIEMQGEYLVPKRVQKVRFGFTALSLSLPQQILFRYQLEGFDNSLSEPGKLREAEYTNLPPGHYRIHVIACNNDGVWNNAGAVLPIYIPAAFIQTLLFKTLLAALIGLLLLTAYHYRTNYLLRQTKARLYERMSERERIARDLHDTFFQGIQGLLLRFQTGTNGLKPNEPTRTVFEEILNESDQIMLEGRELVLDLRTRLTDEEGLAQALAQVCERLKVLHPIDYIMSIQGKPILMKADVREALFNIGKEALANAFRHSNATRIEIELAFSSALVSLNVRDDGCGISTAIQESGSRAGHFGLPGMRERAEHIGASFELWSQVNAVTEIAVHVPTQRASLSHKKS